ncbi:hypothetical protein HNR23_001303 [Nocardiopsis mwathae]|uniref:Uncharacterized protein n=1 Tax=Nocardiopsis mwathae TaxID=1472723 RepID=A0A7X0D4J0_9ACTN|nr:hypothetical protein [Nocardiopsis mwathae]MBB6171243.1 hypothetical protein [Nocardiopsis mwathae]
MTMSIARLTWFYAKRLVRSPFVWLAVAGIILLQGLPSGRGDTGQLQAWGALAREAIQISEMAAAAMFLAGLFPAVRDARYGGAVTAPLGPVQRSIALLAAVTLCGAALGALPWATVPLFVNPAEVAGTLTPAELATPPLIAAAGGVAGVLIGTWTRSLLPALVPVLVIPSYLFLAEFMNVGSTLVDAPAAGAAAAYTAADALLRPQADGYSSLWGIPAVHVVQLLCLIAAGYAAAVLRSLPGLRRRATAAGLTVLLLAGVAAAYTDQRSQGDLWSGEGPDIPSWVAVPERVCEDHDGVTYCGYAGYERWIPYWRRAVEPVVAALPPTQRADLPEVALQSFESPQATVLDGVAVPVEIWDTDPLWSEQDLATQFVQLTLGLPERWHYGECTLRGQARLPLYFWLATRPAPDEADQGMWTVWGEDATGARTEDIATALALAEAPEDRIVRGLDRHWERLTSPDATSADAARLLGVDVTDAHRARAEEELDRIYVADHTSEFTLLDEENAADENADPDLPPCR